MKIIERLTIVSLSMVRGRGNTAFCSQAFIGNSKFGSDMKVNFKRVCSHCHACLPVIIKICIARLAAAVSLSERLSLRVLVAAPVQGAGL